MNGIVLYLVISIIVSVLTSIIIFKATDLTKFGISSRTLFLLYFVMSNILAWPLFLLLCVSMVVNKEID